MSTTSINPKTEIANLAAAKNLSVAYSGKENIMFVKGDEIAAKKFVTLCQFKGKTYFGFKVRAAN
jgi:hypothetical protein